MFWVVELLFCVILMIENLDMSSTVNKGTESNMATTSNLNKNSQVKPKTFAEIAARNLSNNGPSTLVPIKPPKSPAYITFNLKTVSWGLLGPRAT